MPEYRARIFINHYLINADDNLVYGHQETRSPLNNAKLYHCRSRPSRVFKRPIDRLMEIMTAVGAHYCPAHSPTVIFSTVIVLDRTNEVAPRSLTIETFFEYSVRVLQASSFGFMYKVAALSALGVEGSVEAATCSSD